MLAPRARRRRIRIIILFLLDQSIIELDNENDFTIYETGLSTLARVLPLDNVADNELTSEQSEVCDCLDSKEDAVTTGEPSAGDVEGMLDDLKVYLTAAGL